MSNIIEKIKKLLNLSKDGCNRHIAEMAAEKAQELIQENNISDELLTEEGTSRKAPSWLGFIYRNGVCWRRITMDAWAFGPVEGLSFAALKETLKW
jgi:hypothetical protein